MNLKICLLAVALALYTGPVFAAGLQLRSDRIHLIPLRAETVAGNLVPVPVGDVLAVVISDPTAAAVDIEINPATGVNDLLRIVPLKKAVTGLTVTVTDTAGLTSIGRTFDLVDPATIVIPPQIPVKLRINEGSVVTIPQPTPLQ